MARPPFPRPISGFPPPTSPALAGYRAALECPRAGAILTSAQYSPKPEFGLGLVPAEIQFTNEQFRYPTWSFSRHVVGF